MTITGVRSHVRTSAKGATYRVRAHRRAVTWGEVFAAARSQVRGGGSVGAAALAGSALMAITYLLYGVFSFVAALMCAVGLVSLGFVGWAVNKRRGFRGSHRTRGGRFSGVFSPRRRLKAWWHSRKRAWVRKLIPKFVRKYV